MRSLHIFFILLSILLYGCKSSHKQSAETPTVTIAKVVAEKRVTHRTFISTLQPNYIAIIQPRVNGYLVTKHFSNGMPVRRGDILFKIDPRQQRANMLAAKANLATAQAQAIEAQNNYNRAVPLAAIDAISQAQLDQYTAQYEAAQASIASAEQQLNNALLEVEYTTITATINGVISASEAYVGDYVGPNTKFATLTRIENVDTLCCDVAIPMAQYLQIAGRKSFTYQNKDLLSDITLTLADGSIYPYKGSYSYTKSAVADTEGTIIIVVCFPNPDYLLKSGQFARVEAAIGSAKELLTIPKTALNQIQGIESVWIVDADSVAHYKQVKSVEAIGSNIVIEGLTAGQNVVIGGGNRLINGQKVKVL